MSPHLTLNSRNHLHTNGIVGPLFAGQGCPPHPCLFSTMEMEIWEHATFSLPQQHDALNGPWGLHVKKAFSGHVCCLLLRRPWELDVQLINWCEAVHKPSVTNQPPTSCLLHVCLLGCLCCPLMVCLFCFQLCSVTSARANRLHTLQTEQKSALS